jgi:uncharacterized membrane protein YvbJ
VSKFQAKHEKVESDAEKQRIMATGLRACPDCGHQVSSRADRCPQCGGPLWHKTAKEVHGSWKGLGLLDLIPGIRNLSYPVRLILLIIIVTLLVIFEMIFVFPRIFE